MAVAAAAAAAAAVDDDAEAAAAAALTPCYFCSLTYLARCSSTLLTDTRNE